MLILVGFDTPPAIDGPVRPANMLGMWRSAMLVPDLDAAYRVLVDDGIGTMSEPVEMSMGEIMPALRFLCFRGPDGEVLELIEQPAR